MNRAKAHVGHYVFLTISLLLAMAVALSLGTTEIPLKKIIDSLNDFLTFRSASDNTSVILFEIRLPRVLLGFTVGALLGISGAAIQGMFRNPLAEPGILGVSSGATLSVMLAIVLFPGLVTILSNILGLFTLPLFAFIGALVATLIVMTIQAGSGLNTSTLILAGIGVNLLAATGIGLCSYLATDQQLRTLTFWGLGSLSSANWDKVWVCLIGLALCLPVLWLQHQCLNALLLGDSEARHLGFNIQRVKRLVVTFSALAVACAVAFCGLIGFIGLVVPHMLRLIFGPNHKHLLIMSALLGGLLLVLADLLCRLLLSPAELPIGIATASLGTPIFLLLLVKSRSQWI